MAYRACCGQTEVQVWPSFPCPQRWQWANLEAKVHSRMFEGLFVARYEDAVQWTGLNGFWSKTGIEAWKNATEYDFKKHSGTPWNILLLDVCLYQRYETIQFSERAWNLGSRCKKWVLPPCRGSRSRRVKPHEMSTMRHTTNVVDPRTDREPLWDD